MARIEEQKEFYKYAQKFEAWAKESGLLDLPSSVIMPVAEFAVALCFYLVIKRHSLDGDKLDEGFEHIKDSVQDMVHRMLEETDE